MLASAVFLLSLAPAARAQPAIQLIKPRLEIPIPFINFSDAVQANGSITVPFLAQYISGVYRYLLGTVGILAAAMIIVGGFQYLTAGGDKTRVEKGRQRIQNALIGLVLAFGSYTLLWSINPDLVSFASLQIGSVSTERFDGEDWDPGNDPPSTAPPSATTLSELASHAVAKCSTNAECDIFCKSLKPDKSNWPKRSEGMMDPALAKPIKDYLLSDAFPHATNSGVTMVTVGAKVVPDRVLVQGNGARAHPGVIEGLYNAAKQAAIDFPDHNYWIHISGSISGYRDMEGQITVGCTFKRDPDTKAIIEVTGAAGGTCTGAVACIGGSNHGVGYAIDMKLYDGTTGKTGTDTGVVAPSTATGGKNLNTTTQCGVPAANSKRFDQIMTKAGWVRYDAEVWHYEYGSYSGGRCKYPDCPYPPPKFCNSDGTPKKKK